MDNGLRFLEMIQKVFPVNSEVSFYFLKPITLRSRKKLKAFLLKLVKQEANAAATLSFVFCSDPYLLAMNRKFLGHDYFTDILTFPLDPIPGVVHGEMYLSVDRIRDNAKQLAAPTERELHRVIFHGVLHLCGYNDKTNIQAKEIRAREDFYLKKYFRR